MKMIPITLETYCLRKTKGKRNLEDKKFQMSRKPRKPRRLDNSEKRGICAEIFVNWVGGIGAYGPAVLNPG